MRLTHLARLVAAPLGLLLALSVASATSAQVATLESPDSTPAPESQTATEELQFEDRADALLAFAQCMRDNGIEMDDPQVGEGGGRGGFFRPGPGGFDSQGEEFSLAMGACSPILEAARPELDPAAEQERLETELALAQCLRDNGYPQYPDPAADADGRLQRGGQGLDELGIDFRSERFQAARQTCADSLGVEAGPGRGRGPGGNT